MCIRDSFLYNTRCKDWMSTRNHLSRRWNNHAQLAQWVSDEAAMSVENHCYPRSPRQNCKSFERLKKFKPNGTGHMWKVFHSVHIQTHVWTVTKICPIYWINHCNLQIVWFYFRIPCPTNCPSNHYSTKSLTLPETPKFSLLKSLL